MAGELPQDPPQGQLLIYQDGSLNLQVRLDGQTVWLPQRLIAELFQVSVKTANEHLVNIYSEGELGRESTIRSFRIVQRETSRDVARQVEHFSLDAILAVGYRVRSARGGRAPARARRPPACGAGRAGAVGSRSAPPDRARAANAR